MKSLKQDSIQADIFTPRSYQVELLDSALQRNTIVCLGTGTGKTFIAVMLIKEKAHQVRPARTDGGKRSVYVVNNAQLVEEEAKVIDMHLDVHVGAYTGTPELDFWDTSRWQQELDHNQVIVTTARIFLDMLNHKVICMSSINLIVLDECHLAVGEHPYVHIMEHYDKCPDEHLPRILGLTASVLSDKCKSPLELEQNLLNLETSLRSTAETASDILLSDLFSARPKESIVNCEAYDDTTGLVREFSQMIEETLDFMEDYTNVEDSEGGKDPQSVARTILMECHYVLHVLGPWCAGRIAETLSKQVTKLVDHERHTMAKYFLKLTLTQLNVMNRVIEDIYDVKVQCLEDFWLFMSPKVLKLIEILQEYKPDDNFMIIGDDDHMDFGGMDSEDSMDLSDEEQESEDEKSDKKKKNSTHYVAVKRLPPEGAVKDKEEDYISGIVFVERRHAAFALNKLIVELCNWDPELFFIRSHHITGHTLGKAGEAEVLYKKQEDILRKFRQKELNLLISTSVLEEGVDVPRCNLIVRFDTPTDYRSYVQTKGRARAPRSKFYLMVNEERADEFNEELKIFKGIEQILMSKCHSRSEREEQDVEQVTEENMPYYMPAPQDPTSDDDPPKVTLKTAIGLVNRYCAKLPSDAFTHLTPKCTVEVTVNEDGTPLYTASLQLPINSPIKEPIKDIPRKSKKLAKMSVALLTCEILHKAGELDHNLLPVGKEMIKYEDEESEWEEAELHGQARPGTTKRKQYYYKRIARPLLGHPQPVKKCFLYQFDCKLTCPITEEQNTRGRKIHAPEDSPRGFGIITEKKMPLVPYFPVFTRSGEVTVALELIYSDITFSTEQLEKLKQYHRFVFCKVLRLEKDPMIFDPQSADCSYILVPLNSGEQEEVVIDWDFMSEVAISPMKQSQRKYLFQPNKKKFQFNTDDFEDAVVMPSYRNIDQPQYFYVAEIRHDLHPKSGFPSPELYDNFEQYYCSKYGLEITNKEQPLLDVDHTSARLNLLTPRYMNQKGVALPTSSAETRRSRRENLQQKQILLPELCDIHRFPASLWRKAVCIPAILYRMNYLLVAEELREQIAREAHIGVSKLLEDFRFPFLEFGFSTKPSDAIPASKDTEQIQKETETAENESVEADEAAVEKSLDSDLKMTNSESPSSDIVASSCEENKEESGVGSSCHVNTGRPGPPENSKKITSSENVTSTDEQHRCNDKIYPPVSTKNHIDLENRKNINNKLHENIEESHDERNGFKSVIKSMKVLSINDEQQTGSHGTTPVVSKTACEEHFDDFSKLDLGDVSHHNGAITPNDALLAIIPNDTSQILTNNSELIDSELTKGSPRICSRTLNISSEDHCISDGKSSVDKLMPVINNSAVMTEQGGEQCQNHVLCSAQQNKISSESFRSPDSRKPVSSVLKNQSESTSTTLPQECTSVSNCCDEPNGAVLSSEFESDPVIFHATGSAENDTDHNTRTSLSNTPSEFINSMDSQSISSGASIDVPNDSPSSDSLTFSESATSNKPTEEPSTDVPIQDPHTNVPTEDPITNVLKDNPGTDISTVDRSRNAPTKDPSTDVPTEDPGTDVPTEDPSTDVPTGDPGTDEPTKDPCTDVPTEDPGTDVPTEGPGTDVPTEDPSTDVPTEDPSIFERTGEDSCYIRFDFEEDLQKFVGPSPCTILQTLTMSNANDFFNLERLETIGDSFLKFAITVYLYCSYPGIHEGKLSYLRSKQVSNYNLYKLGKKKGFPDCMVAAKFEPTENWLPPGYIIQKEGAYKGLSVHISSQLKPGESEEQSDSLDVDLEAEAQSDRDDHMKSAGDSDVTKVLGPESQKEYEKFNKELEEIISMDDGEKVDASNALKNLIPYNLQTQHSLPDKSIADCVEALIGCYLVTCGQRAALMFMSWLGLKVLPCSKSDPAVMSPEKAFTLPLPPSPLLTHVPLAMDNLNFYLDGYEEFEQKIQYKFRDRSYLLQAFTHASYHYNNVTDCYQRLEFLGDAILDYVITRHLFEDSRKHSPGILTDLRSALVNNNIFAALAVKWDFHKFFKSISPQLFYVIEKFVMTQKDNNDEIGLDEEYEDDDDSTTGGSEDIEIPKALGDIFESVAGAIYLDSSMSLDTVWRVYYRMMKPQIDAFTERIPKSPVRELLEMEPETAKFEKPERTMDGKIRVSVNVVGKGSFRGVGRNYRIAKSAAARRALKYIKQYNIQLAMGMIPIETMA